MPIISRIGRKAPRVRLLIGAIYAALLAGAVTMVYPFLLMISGSTKSALDTPQALVVPPYLVDDAALYQKHMEGFFNESVAIMSNTYGERAVSFTAVTPPEETRATLIDDWLEFLADTDLPAEACTVGYLHAPVTRGVQPLNLRQLRSSLSELYDGDLDRMNAEQNTAFATWSSFVVLPKTYLSRRERPLRGGFSETLGAFIASRPPAERYYPLVESFFRQTFLQSQYGRDITVYNKTHGTDHAAWSEVSLPRRAPAGTAPVRADWEDFVRNLCGLPWVRADDSATVPYRAYLKAKYGTIDGLNRSYGASWAGFDAVTFPTVPPPDGLPGSDWAAFLQGWKDPETGLTHLLPLEALHLETTELRFRDFLQSRYESLQKLNAAAGTTFASWDQILPPQRDLHYQDFLARRSDLRWEFTIRNFLTVADYILLHGRAVVNTVVFCGLSILAAIIVNPLAAYALSRFKPPSTYKVLLFLMLTMAFPPMVTQIPNFLLLRELDLLNTFAALILPGLANGYSIFLLKGFFDSLPQELYEASEIDGASEFRIFWQITMSLSKPILAVIALNAFTMAYSNFMFALLICQDESMWTLMPWLYQLQMRSGQGVIFASLLIAAVPTFLVFVFCQNIIMRGIVVPVEK